MILVTGAAGLNGTELLRRLSAGGVAARAPVRDPVTPRRSGAKRRRRSDFRRHSQGKPSMKHFMIKYQFANGTSEAWHREIGAFIAALNGDPELKGKINYRVMKNRDDSSYYHLATAADETAIKNLQSRDFFKHYTEQTRQVAGGEVTVTPIELIAETAD